MTQQNNSTNWVIQDANVGGQMIKLLQPSGKPISVMTTAVPAQSIKIIKPASAQDGGQVFTTTNQSIVKSIGTTKLIKSVNLAKGEGGQVIRTIKLTPQQLQQIKSTNMSVQVPIQIATSRQQQVIQTSKHSSPPILDHGIARKNRIEPYEIPMLQENYMKKGKVEKAGKGLRHFSMKVCEKVREKGTTSYNEVADELVEEFTNSNMLGPSLAEQYDQKNIRRRVYDALNVLMAMNIISKEKKEIKWIGLPSNSVQECMQLERQRDQKLKGIRQKYQQLRELLLNQVAFKNLVHRNKQQEESLGPPAPNSYIQLPFIVLNTNKKTVIDCSISPDKKEYMFHFNDRFEINDDREVLKKIGMLKGLDKGECSEEDLEHLKSLVPKALQDYINQMAANHGNFEMSEDLSGAGPSCMPFSVDDFVESQLDEDNSRQSSSGDPMSPSTHYSEDDDSDMSSDIN